MAAIRAMSLAMFPRRALVVAAAALALLACRKDRPPDEASGAAPPSPACAQARKATGELRWIEDDLTAATACARSRGRPLVIDEWAPWCHTCLSMKAYVYPDPALAPLADRFVWLAADTDQPANAALVARYPPAAWPTFFVIDADGEVLGRFVGAASVAQLRDFLLESERTFLDRAHLDPASPVGQLVAGERAAVAAAQAAPGSPERRDQLERAIVHYDEALARAPADWPRRPDVLVSRQSALLRRGHHRRCVTAAIADLDATGRAASATDFIAVSRGCAGELTDEDPALVRELRERAAARLAALIDDAAAPLSADDRGDAMMYLRMLLDDLGRPDEARAIAERQLSFLAAAATAAPTPLAAMTYNWPRAEVHAYLGRALELVPALERSAADLPREYDPPYRLAWLHLQAGQAEAALPWARRAAELAYGPRKTRAQAQLVEVLRALGDSAGELAARRELVAIYEGLPAGQARVDELERARAALAELEARARETPAR
jgi:thioredoxin-like negative regulator of GroEL